MKVKRINISLEPWMDEKLLKIAKKCGTNRSGAIRLLIENADDIDKLQKDSYKHQSEYKAPTSHNVQNDNKLVKEMAKLMSLEYPEKIYANCYNLAMEAVDELKVSCNQ